MILVPFLIAFLLISSLSLFLSFSHSWHLFRDEALQLFQTHVNEVHGTMSNVKIIKINAEKILKDSTSNSNDHVGREKRRLGIISQKLELDREHYELDTTGVQEEREQLETSMKGTKTRGWGWGGGGVGSCCCTLSPFLCLSSHSQPLALALFLFLAFAFALLLALSFPLLLFRVVVQMKRRLLWPQWPR